MNNENVREYLSLIAKMGLNVQPGQKVLISCPTDVAWFARLAVEECFKAGAGDVFVRWTDEGCARARYQNAPDNVFDYFPPWQKQMLDSLSEEGAAYLAISANDPEALKGIDTAKIMRSVAATQEATKGFRAKTMGNVIPWCVAAVPTEAWAQKVFPGEAGAVDKLWDAILTASRVGGGKAVENWEAHTAELARRGKILNGHAFTALRFKNGLGTDLTIGLPKGHVWAGGAEHTTSGTRFLANIPTEELFTAPDRARADGVVYSTKPLVYQGNLIENFRLTFKGGKVTEARAEKNEQLLKTLLSAVPNAERLGEVALVPHDSPISNSGVLFYNTLFDENASCHLALGRAYPMCVDGASGKTDEEQEAMGLNISKAHEDFMIGSADMAITGITADGGETPVFVNGSFTF